MTSGTVIRGALFAGVSALALGVAGGAVAAEAPSNEDLYRMILELRANQEKLAGEAARAKDETAAAKAELARTKAALDSARRKIEDAATVANDTRDELGRARAVLGSQPSASVVRIPERPGQFITTGEFLYLKPVTETIYAVSGDETAANGPFLGSKTHDAQPGFEPGFRAGVRLRAKRGRCVDQLRSAERS